MPIFELYLLLTIFELYLLLTIEDILSSLREMSASLIIEILWK